MSWTTIGNTIRAKFNVLAQAYGWSVIWPNARNANVPDGFHVAYSHLPGESSQQSVGPSDTRRFRHTGIVQVTIYDKLENGDASLFAALDVVREEFQAQTVGGITYRTPSHSVLGQDGPHFAIAVTIPYYSDEVA